MREIYPLAILLHGILAVTHPEQYRYLLNLRQWTFSEYSGCQPVLCDWPFIHPSGQIIANRVTPYHRDKTSPISVHDFLLSMGTYEKEAIIDLQNVGVSVPYDSGTMLSMASRLVSHGVSRCTNDRLCFAQFVPEALCQKRGIPVPPLPTVQSCLMPCVL